MTETFTLYKLIILYMLDQVDFPLSNLQISNFILEHEYTTYFTLQQALGDLQETNLIEEDSEQKTYYHLTEQGRQTLGYFQSKISAPIREDIHTYLKDHHMELRLDASIHANYYRINDNDYAAHCVVKERDSILIDLTLHFPLPEQAAHICKQWEEKSQSVYAHLIKELLL